MGPGGIAATHAREIRSLRAPDTSRKAQIREFLATTMATSSQERYRLALQANAERMEGQKWPDSSLRKAAGIDQSNAAKVRRELPVATESRKRRKPDNS
jgi:hypothetical protein